MADTHFFAGGRGKDGLYWNRTLHSSSEEIGEALVKSVSTLNPEFVVHCGDLTGFCSMENFEVARQIMDRFGCPWYAVPGNHDTWFPGVRDALSGCYGLPRGQCYYVRSLAGFLFIFLDTSYWLARDGSISPYLDKSLYDAGKIKGLVVPPDETVWLESLLESHKREKVILISHTPLAYKETYPMREMPDGLINHQKVRDLLSHHRNVLVAFSGHWHINDVYVKEDIAFCQTGSLREYPFEFRLVEAGERCLSISTHGLTDTRFERASLVPERGNIWVRGTPDDREFGVAWKVELARGAETE